ncbi:MAG: hypothetical protein WC680_05175 [Sulfuricurvum sp.]
MKISWDFVFILISEALYENGTTIVHNTIDLVGKFTQKGGPISYGYVHYH